MNAVFEWPSVRPALKPFRWALDGGGRDLVIDLVNGRGLKTMLEVGVYCGGSSLQWLDACPGLSVFGVDPYPADSDVGQYFAANADFYRRTVDLRDMTEEEFIAQMSEPDSLFPAVLSNLWDYRDRFTPVRGFAPEALYKLHAAGVVPDIAFLDAMKTGDEMHVVRELWPDCIITGDDWCWQDGNGEIPIRAPVLAFADKHNVRLTAELATWILTPRGEPLVPRPMHSAIDSEQPTHHPLT